MTNHVRLTLSRNRGFDLQALSLATNGLLAVVVARPTKWGNPFVIGEPAGESGEIVADAKEAVRRFRELLDEEFDGVNVPLIEAISALRGKNLACWCKAGPCHADVLLEIANRPTCEET